MGMHAAVFLCLIVLLTLSILYIQANEVRYAGNQDIEVVVSRYNEDLRWLQKPEFDGVRITVYNKGPKEPNTYGRRCKVINLPNVGRCDHTYLHHIISNYGNLADVTVFLPASCFDKDKSFVTKNLLENVYATENTVLPNILPSKDVRKDMYGFFLDNWTATNTANASLNSERTLMKSPIRPFGAWFDRTFPNHPTVNVVCYYGIFAVSKQQIVQHPVSRYNDLIRYVQEHSNPEAGHYMERSWGAVFYPYPEPCVLNLNRAPSWWQSIFT